MGIALLMGPVVAVARENPQVELKENAGLPDLLAYSALHNAGLQAAFDNWQAKLAVVPQVKALPNPTLSYSYFIQEVETRVGPQQHKIGITQSFPWFGKLKLRGNAAAESANAANQQYQNLKLQLFFQVKEAYYEYYLVARTIDILKENLQLLENLEQVLLTKYRTGTASYANLLNIQVEREKLNQRLLSTQDRVRPVKARLNTLLDRPVDAPLPELPQKIETALPEPLLAQLVSALKRNNPGLKALDAVQTNARFNLKLAKKNRYPDFALGLDYVVTADTTMPGVPDSGKDPLMAMVSVRLPIWGKKNRAAIHQAQARLSEAKNTKTQMQNDLLARLETVYYKYSDAKRKTDLYKRSLLPRARQAMEVSRSAFTAGNMDYPGFIDTQRTFLTFQLELEQAMTRTMQRLAELEMLSGEEIGKTNPPSIPSIPSVSSVSSVVQKNKEEK